MRSWSSFCDPLYVFYIAKRIVFGKGPEGKEKIYMNKKVIKAVNDSKLLGINLSSNGNYNNHVMKEIIPKIKKEI